MTVQLFWHVSRLHFLCNLQQELFGVHQRPQVKLLVQPWHREMFSETFHGLRASSSRSSSHLHQDWFAIQIATGTNITKADFPVEALRTPLFTTTEFTLWGVYGGGFGRSDANASCSYLNWAQKLWNISGNVSWSLGLVQLEAAHICIMIYLHVRIATVLHQDFPWL